MLRKLKIFALTVILGFTSTKVAHSNNMPSTTINAQDKAAYEYQSNIKLKEFIEFANKIITNCEKNHVGELNTLQKKWDSANSDISVCIIMSCNGAQFLELSRFKLKNKKLFLKLSNILLNIIANIKIEDLKQLPLTNEEMADLQTVWDYISLLTSDITTPVTQANTTSSKAKNEKLKEIMVKIKPALTQLFEYNWGLDSNLLSVLGENFEKYLSEALDESEITELHRFVFKTNGAYDKIVEKIDSIWEIVVKNLS